MQFLEVHSAKNLHFQDGKGNSFCIIFDGNARNDITALNLQGTKRKNGDSSLSGLLRKKVKQEKDASLV